MTRVGLQAVQVALRKFADPEAAAIVSRFFRSGEGEYGAGDRFLGIKVPVTRALHNEFRGDLKSVDNIRALLCSEYNEERFLGLLYLIDLYEGHKVWRQATPAVRASEVVELYLQLAAEGKINNWNLVDCSAPNIIGDYYLRQNDRSPLFELLREKSLWMRRIAVISTLAFIRGNELNDTFEMSKWLIHQGESEDLMHKACGWMLREAGKRNEAALRQFLDDNVSKMPRVMLRYSIEKFPKPERDAYLSAPSEMLSTKKRARP